jgi:hypothetical protein
MTGKERPGLSEARRMLAARKGPPTESDRPRRPSHPPRVLPRQIDIHGTVHGSNEDADGWQEGRRHERVCPH